jgi:acetyl esterase/lipase
MHKPSTLWPPPPDQLTQDVHSGLRSRIRSIAGLDRKSSNTSLKNGSARPQDTGSTKIPVSSTRNDGLPANNVSPDLGQKGDKLDVGTTAPLPAATPSSGSKPNVVEVTAKDGTQLRIDSQIQLYVSNDLVVHPLVSPALSYLGGLPPMLFIEGDREVLRDEGIYTSVF